MPAPLLKSNPHCATKNAAFLVSFRAQNNHAKV